ncbi:MAG: redoxin domain-containing protein [Acidobacteriota bacterium]
MRNAWYMLVVFVATSGCLLAADPYPDVIQVQPTTAMAGQVIPNFKVVGTHFDNFKGLEFRKSSGPDTLIKVTKIIKKDPAYVIAQVQIPQNATGKRVVVVKTSVGASVITANADNGFQITPYKAKGPDLKISQIRWGTFDGTLRVYVQNAGGTPVKNFKVDLYLGGAIKQRYTFAPTLPAGSTVPFETTSLQIPKTAGTYIVKAVVDPVGQITETNETNNSRETTFVQPADELVIPSGTFATPSLVRNKTAPNFTHKDYRTKPLTLYDYRGKPILLVLGTMWSLYTQVETAALKSIYSEYSSKGLVIIEVLYEDTSSASPKDPTPELLKVWTEANELPFPALSDTLYSDSSHSAYMLYASQYQPMNYFIRKDGTIYNLIEGFYETAIRNAVKEITE